MHAIAHEQSGACITQRFVHSHTQLYNRDNSYLFAAILALFQQPSTNQPPCKQIFVPHDEGRHQTPMVRTHLAHRYSIDLLRVCADVGLDGVGKIQPMLMEVFGRFEFQRMMLHMFGANWPWLLLVNNLSLCSVKSMC
jgi:hypothetical protein